MRRVIEIAWGVVILLVATAVLAWIAYSYTLAEAPPKYPWWWAVILVVVWSYGIKVGIKRLRGGSREKAQKKAHS